LPDRVKPSGRQRRTIESIERCRRGGLDGADGADGEADGEGGRRSSEEAISVAQTTCSG
jgi:hypothetical protein